MCAGVFRFSALCPLWIHRRSWSVGFEARIVAFALWAQGIASFEVQAFSVHRESVVRMGGRVLGAASSFSFHCSSSCGCRGTYRFRNGGGAAEFLAQPAVSVCSLHIFIHCKPHFANGIANSQLIWIFCVPLVQWNNGLALINVFHSRVMIPIQISCSWNFLKSYWDFWKEMLRIGPHFPKRQFAQQETIEGTYHCHVKFIFQRYR